MGIPDHTLPPPEDPILNPVTVLSTIHFNYWFTYVSLTDRECLKGDCVLFTIAFPGSSTAPRLRAGSQ